MSSDDPQNEPVTSDRREAVREKAIQVQAQQSRARVIRGTTIAIAVAAVVVIAAVVVTWTVGSAASKPLLDPANVQDDGIVVTAVTGVIAQDSTKEMGAVPGDQTASPVPEATPTPTPEPTSTSTPAVDIRVYVDYLSPGSRDFQLANAQQLSSWVEQGAATLTYFPVAMLTSKSNGTKYSLRAASSAACVATHSPDTFFGFTHALLEKQPALDSDGFSDKELADLAIASGSSSPKVVRACIEEEEYAAWAKTATDRALQAIPGTDGATLTGAPMILVNGTQYVGALDDPAEFSQFVLTLASDDADKNATPTPTATPTP
jgi:protein-disulfide isomerase